MAFLLNSSAKAICSGPDAGIGKYLYSGDDYKEYYSQMPAHNTVVVDGISTYAVMWSQHPFTVVDTCGTVGRSHSVLNFIEPETNSDQQRTTGIVRTSPTGGYYVDIFRSQRMDGKDKTHDYFYHNLGQHMMLTASTAARSTSSLLTTWPLPVVTSMPIPIFMTRKAHRW